jgi:hypothetical protein
MGGTNNCALSGSLTETRSTPASQPTDLAAVAAAAAAEHSETRNMAATQSHSVEMDCSHLQA